MKKGVVKPKKKIQIVGCSDHKSLAAWGNPEYTIWGVNNLCLSVHPDAMSNVGAWFEIHLIEKKDKQWFRRRQKEFRGQNVNDYVQMIASLKCPLYMQKKWEEIPNSVEYPLKDVMEFWKTDYINNTITYEILLAGMLIHQNPDEYEKYIGVYGVDMATQSDLLGNGEYQHQRPSCEWALGLVCGSGINIEIPKEADLLKVRFLYGFNEPERNKWDHKLEHIKKTMIGRMNEAQLKKDMGTKQVEQYTGAIQAINELRRIWD